MKSIINRKAFHNYIFLEKFEAGIVLTGNEIKQIRAGNISLDEAFVLIRDVEAYLINAHIATYSKAADKSEDTRRERKLLMNRKEIEYLIGKMSGSNLTLVPSRLYFVRNYAKIEVALAKGKKKADKREAMKKKDEIKEAQKFLRSDKLNYQDETRRD